jgi:hypothetical protein
MSKGIVEVDERIRELRKEIYVIECELDEIIDKELHIEKQREFEKRKKEMRRLIRIRDGKMSEDDDEHETSKENEPNNIAYSPDESDLSNIPNEDDPW